MFRLDRELLQLLYTVLRLFLLVLRLDRELLRLTMLRLYLRVLRLDREMLPVLCIGSMHSLLSLFTAKVTYLRGLQMKVVCLWLKYGRGWLL